MVHSNSLINNLPKIAKLIKKISTYASLIPKQLAVSLRVKYFTIDFQENMVRYLQCIWRGYDKCLENWIIEVNYYLLNIRLTSS